MPLSGAFSPPYLPSTDADEGNTPLEAQEHFSCSVVGEG